jgi:hypothetical protein
VKTAVTPAATRRRRRLVFDANYQRLLWCGIFKQSWKALQCQRHTRKTTQL